MNKMTPITNFAKGNIKIFKNGLEREHLFPFIATQESNSYFESSISVFSGIKFCFLQKWKTNPKTNHNPIPNPSNSNPYPKLTQSHPSKVQF